MKRNFKSLVQAPYGIIACLFLVLVGCTDESTPTEVTDVISVTDVALSPTSITLTEGECQTLTVTISPSNADNQKVKWGSNNSSVATVAEGVVSALKAGSATITVTTEDGGKTATCEVLVKAEQIATEEDLGDLNYGEEGAAGDNIDEEKDIYDGGSH